MNNKELNNDSEIVKTTENVVDVENEIDAIEWHRIEDYFDTSFKEISNFWESTCQEFLMLHIVSPKEFSKIIAKLNSESKFDEKIKDELKMMRGDDVDTGNNFFPTAAITKLLFPKLYEEMHFIFEDKSLEDGSYMMNSSSDIPFMERLVEFKILFPQIVIDQDVILDLPDMTWDDWQKRIDEEFGKKIEDRDYSLFLAAKTFFPEHDIKIKLSEDDLRQLRKNFEIGEYNLDKAINESLSNDVMDEDHEEDEYTTTFDSWLMSGARTPPPDEEDYGGGEYVGNEEVRELLNSAALFKLANTEVRMR